ncbi:hypothetical protein GCM10007424_15620 [Flavobacterium suaedae]|uniref:Histidine kinase n=1 Tax=Flavobacterium suaedae TaxID=1767027 RepID=A0ABQ1JSI9_9FLAO|nr:hypothetical protein GCM10007424_15620 [Flavobacterium suaedae]
MTFLDFSKKLSEVSPIFLIIGIIVGSIYYRKLDTLHKSIFFYLVLMLLVDFLSRYFGFISNKNNNLIILIVYSLVEVIVVSYFYYKFLLKKVHKLLKAICFAAILYIAYEFIYYAFFDTNVKSFQPYAKVADNFVIILLALSFLQEKIDDFKEQKWDNFRLNIVILVFFTFNTLIFLPINFIVNENSGVKFYFWAGNSILLLLFYSYLIGKIWKNGKQNKLQEK